MWRRLRDLVKGVAGRRRFEAELREEIDEHLRRRAEDLVKQGFTPDEARRRAHVEFGSIESHKERVRATRVLAGVRAVPGQLWRELRLGARRLASAPLFAAFAVLTLAVAIGVTTAAYSGIYATFRQTHVEEDARLLVLDENLRRESRFSWPDYQDLSAQQTSFKTLAVWTHFGTALVAAGTAELADAEGVSGEFFDTLGVRARIGRTLRVADDRPDAPPAAMISERVWRERFRGSPTVLGAAVKIANRLFTVVGVVPASFHGMSMRAMRGVTVWVPLSHVPTAGDGFAPFDRAARDRRWLGVIGRLRPDAGFQQAQAEVALIPSRIDAMNPRPQETGGIDGRAQPRHWSLRPAFESNPTAATPDAMRIILGLPMLVFLVACTNLANLMLSRGMARRHAMAVRRALGASRGRLVREEMSETVIVAGVGGLLGLLVSQAILSGSLAYLNEPLAVLAPGVLPTLRLEPMVMAFAVGGTLLTMLVAGFVPAWQISRLGTRHVLIADADTSSPRWRGRSNLIALQVTASVGLFLIAVVCVRVLSDGRLGPRVAEPAPNGLALAAVPFGRQQQQESHVRETVERVLNEMGKAPGVGAVAAAAGLSLTDRLLPLYRSVWAASPEQPFSGDERKDMGTNFTIATPGVFRVLGTPMLFGRGFEDRDTAGAERVAVVSEGLAIALFGTSNVVGRQMLLRVSTPGRASRGDIREVRIVGVIPGPLLNAQGRREIRIYVPFAQEYDANVVFLARPMTPADGPPVAALERALRGVDPDLALRFSGTSDVLTAGASVIFKFVAVVTGALAALALVLAMTGLYGVLSHVVTRRTRELGLRMALGADSGHVVWTVLREGIRPVIEGLAIGLFVAIILRMLLQVTVEGKLAPIDPIAFLLAIVLLVTAALVACYLPARRASRVDPNVALKDL